MDDDEPGPRPARPRKTPAARRAREARPRAGGPRAASARPASPKPDGDSLTGQLLIAMPGMQDPRFAQSVVFLCAHTSEGAMGLVLNRPLAAPSFEDLLKQLDIKPVPPARSIRLCHGGPVENARGFVLHTTDWTGEGSLRVDDTLALTASLDILKAIAEGGGPRESLLALGYAGWSAGQLDHEMRQNAWLTAPADPSLLFDDQHETKWRRALAKLHIDPANLATGAGHA